MKNIMKNRELYVNAKRLWEYLAENRDLQDYMGLQS